MNLLKDPWIPITEKEGKIRQITLKELLCTNQTFELSHPRDDMEMAALQLLVSLVQCIFMPNDDDELKRNIRMPMEEEDYEKGIKPYMSWFCLDHPKTPFMQDTNVIGGKASASNPEGDSSSIQMLFTGMPAGNDTRTLFVNSDAIKQVCPSCAAIGLFNRGSCSPSFGGGYILSLRGWSGLTVLVYDKDLRIMIWKNMLDKEWAEKYYPLPLNKDVPTWVEHINLNEKVYAASIGLLRGLFWQSMRLFLYWNTSTEEQICSCCGQKTKEICMFFLQNKYSFDHSKETLGVWRHPHSPYVYKKRGNGFVLKAMSFNNIENINIPLWARLCEMHPVSGNSTLAGGSLVVRHYKNIRTKTTPLVLVVGGYRNNQATILERRHEMISIGAGWLNNDNEDELESLTTLVSLALEFQKRLGNAYFFFMKDLVKSASQKNITGKESNRIRKIVISDANTMFYQSTEPTMHKYISAEPYNKLWHDFGIELKKICIQIFDEITKPHLCNVKAIKSYSINKDELSKNMSQIIKEQCPDLKGVSNVL